MKNVNLLILLLFACFFSNGLHAEMVKGDLHKYPRLLVAVLYVKTIVLWILQR